MCIQIRDYAKALGQFPSNFQALGINAAHANVNGHSHSNGHNDEEEKPEEISDFSASVLAHDGFDTTFVGTEDAVYKWRDGKAREIRIFTGFCRLL